MPIALTVVTDQQIENLTATDLSEISRYVPGLNVDAFDKTQPGFSIRGISTEGFSIGTVSYTHLSLESAPSPSAAIGAVNP